MSDLLRRLFGFDRDEKLIKQNSQAQATDRKVQEPKDQNGPGTHQPCNCACAQQQARLEPVWVWAPFKITYHHVRTADEQLLADVLQSIACCPELQHESFNISVKDAEVELWGAVTSEQNSKLAWRMAIETPGVRKVLNKLEVLERN